MQACLEYLEVRGVITLTLKLYMNKNGICLYSGGILSPIFCLVGCFPPFQKVLILQISLEDVKSWLANRRLKDTAIWSQYNELLCYI